ncbi:hypothetical protein BcepSauron_260 [Burkholderia phage BcepSauron]|uniref:Uncharacterized protein n=1 Tax=Burkholderia phage BcepSauron TaxID=2530033 RepID=A0A482MNF2_9CAUD|nr:PmgG-like head morphogenesis [Burkholderia phage BcepSauron]QBQ74640.1 hypothetical protein BcepSauron_260 [Burkholderia phage BcepSauron]
MASSPYTVLIQRSMSADPISVQAPMPETFSMDAGASYEQPLPQGFTSSGTINAAFAAFGVRLAVQAMSAQLWSGNTETNLSLELQFHTETDPVQDVRTPIVNLLKLTMPSTSSTTGLLESPGPSIDFSNQAAAIGSDAFSAFGTSIGSVLGSVGTTVRNAFNRGGPTPQPGSITETSKQSNDSSNGTVPQAVIQNPSLGTAAYWNTKLKNKISIKLGNYMFFESVVITRVSITAASNFDAQTGLPHHCRVLVEFKPLFMLTQQDLDTLFVNPGGGSGGTPGNNSYGFSLPMESINGVAKNVFNSVQSTLGNLF